jgi:hypothetical protein
MVQFPATTEILRSTQNVIEFSIYSHTQTSPGGTQPPFQHVPETFIFLVVKQQEVEFGSLHLRVSSSKTA